MAKFTAVVGTGSEYGQPTEHIFERVIPGDIDLVRERLADALSRIGYRVVSEQPLVVKRNRGASSCSFDVLKCVKSLTIGLTAVNPTSTLATFDYEILNSFITKGDRQTTEREADAIIALALAHQGSLECANCGTMSTGDSRYCRVCGVPSQHSSPAELEVLRLTSGARPAHQLILLGFISALFIAVLSIYLLLFSGKPPKVGLTVLAVGEIFAALSFIYGMSRLHRTLNPKDDAREFAAPESPRRLSAATTSALPPQRVQPSVTEGTTELLVPRDNGRVAVPVKSHEVDTAEIS